MHQPVSHRNQNRGNILASSPAGPPATRCHGVSVSRPPPRHPAGTGPQALTGPRSRPQGPCHLPRRHAWPYLPHHAAAGCNRSGCIIAWA